MQTDSPFFQSCLVELTSKLLLKELFSRLCDWKIKFTNATQYKRDNDGSWLLAAVAELFPCYPAIAQGVDWGAGPSPLLEERNS